MDNAKCPPPDQILASSSYDDTVKLYSADYTTDEWAVTHSLPPETPKQYNFPNAPEPEADESGTGHTSTVWASAFSSCGNYIATCSDDLSIKIWARFTRKDVKGEPGGAFRIGRTEKEGWYCVLTIAKAHERAIYSLDWTDAGSWRPELQEGEIALGRLASVGGDGKIVVYGVIGMPDEKQRCGYAIKHEELVTVIDAHGVYDINHVTWCRLGKPTPSLSKSDGNQNNVSSTRNGGDDEDQVSTKAQDEQLKHEIWQDARDVLATAADDGTVKIWRLNT
jgi:WD40 repeat protein